MEKHFASLKLLDSDTDWKLTETVSYSKLPSSHGMAVKQIYQSNGKFNLVRQYSCGQIFDGRANASQLQVFETVQTDDEKCNDERQMTKSYSDEFKSTNWRFSTRNNILKAPKLMPKKISNEIEHDKLENVSAVNAPTFTSYHYKDDTDVKHEINRVSCAETDKSERASAEIKRIDNTKEKNGSTYEDIKKRLRPLVVKKKNPTNKKINMYYCCLTVCIIPVITVILALFSNLDTQPICNREMVFSNANLELQQKIHGQKTAISHIVRFFDEDYSHLKVLCLIGGTGVGKSYTAEIIRRNFPLKSGIFVYDAMLDHSINADILNSLNLQQLLIIENLKMKDLNIFGDIMDELKKIKDKCTTVLAIFNVEEVSNSLERKVDLVQSRNVIFQEMANKKIDFSIVSYEPLNEETLEICITEAALTSGFTLTNDQVNEIKQSLMVSGSGCKKAYSKVQVTNRY
ncbi:hypothetical protein ANTQUA_LOCUS1564, partial [Anthophora quadrimaculata]